jgi:hypothetical protein
MSSAGVTLVLLCVQMSKRVRLALAVAGVIIAAASLLALAYAWWPLDTAREQFVPPPTLFAPPAGAWAPLEAGGPA